MLNTFHFLRPEWLLLIIPVALLLFFFVRQAKQKNGWEAICDPSLLQYQLTQQTATSAQSARLLHWIIAFIFLIAIISLAGPSWEKKDQPVFQQGSALVIILDLSLSMNSRDIKPSRMERAKLKIIDILKQKKEGQAALIAFAGDAHIVSPLTIDNKTIISLLPSLDSSIMPIPGSHITDAMLTAEQLLKNSGFVQGDILLITDGMDSSSETKLNKQVKRLYNQGYRLSIIGVGSRAGSPIPMPGQSGFVKDSSGQIVLSKLMPAPLKSLSDTGGGLYHNLSLDDKDFKALLDKKYLGNKNIQEQENQVEQWVDAGAYVTLLLIPFALLFFRKGLLAVTLFMVISPSIFSEPVLASQGAASTDAIENVNKSSNDKIINTWNNLWSTPDQQGQKAFNNQNFKKSADKFVNKNWKAGAYYRSGEFDKAAEQYTQSDDAASLYNKGNALANLQKFEQAIQAYDAALEKEPQLEDATKNRDYLKELLAQQEQQKSDQQQSDDSKQADDSEQAEDSDEQSDSQSQKQDQKQSDSSNKQSKEQPADHSEQEKQQDQSESGDKEDKSKDSQQQDGNQSKSGSEQEAPSEQGHNEPVSPEQNNEKDGEDKESLTDKESSTDSDKPEQQAESEPQQEEGKQEGIQDAPQEDVLSKLSQEEQQSLKQWLQRIPDNPGQLLRIKFRNNSLLKQRQQNAPSQYEGTPW